jgi:hypothetical protein
MANDIVTAGVNINVSGGISGRTSGSVKSGGRNNTEKILKSLLSEFKSGNRMADQIAKKALSGFGGAASGGSFMTGLTAAISGFVALTAAAGAAEKPEGQFSMFQKALSPDGQEKVLEFDQLTGEVVDIITMREAEKRGILTKTGEIRAKYAVTSKAIENNIGTLESQRDFLLISDAKLESISNEQVKQEFFDLQITKFKKQIAANLAKKAKMNFMSSDGIDGIDTGSQSIDYNTTGGNNYLIEQNAQDAMDTIKNYQQVSDIVDTQKESNNSSGSIFLDLLTSGNLYGGK